MVSWERSFGFFLVGVRVFGGGGCLEGLQEGG